MLEFLATSPAYCERFIIVAIATSPAYCERFIIVAIAISPAYCERFIIVAIAISPAYCERFIIVAIATSPAYCEHCTIVAIATNPAYCVRCIITYRHSDVVITLLSLLTFLTEHLSHPHTLAPTPPVTVVMTTVQLLGNLCVAFPEGQTRIWKAFFPHCFR